MLPEPPFEVIRGAYVKSFLIAKKNVNVPHFLIFGRKGHELVEWLPG